MYIYRCISVTQNNDANGFVSLPKYLLSKAGHNLLPDLIFVFYTKNLFITCLPSKRKYLNNLYAVS